MKKAIVGAGLLVFITLWAMVFAYLGRYFVDQNPLIELGFYILAGVGWAFPLIPIMRWASRD